MNQKTDLCKQDLSSLESIVRSQEQKDKQFQDFYNEKMLKLEAQKESLEIGINEKREAIRDKRRIISSKGEELASNTAQVRWELERWQYALAEADKKYERVQQTVEDLDNQAREKLFQIPDLVADSQ